MGTTPGCDTHYKSLLINGQNVSFWLGEESNESAEYISTGTVTKQLDNGNYLATGKTLISAYENSVYVKPFGWLYREVEIYKSLLSGSKYGRFIETTHVHDKRYSDSSKESNPSVEENKCVRVK